MPKFKKKKQICKLQSKLKVCNVLFSVYLHIFNHIFCLKFAIFKTDITAFKNSKEEEHLQFKNEEFEAFESVLSPLLIDIFLSFFSGVFL